MNPERPFQILNLLQVIWNWYDMDPVLDLYPNRTFSKLPQQNCSFIFHHFCKTAVKSGRVGNRYSRKLPSLPTLPTFQLCLEDRTDTVLIGTLAETPQLPPSPRIWTRITRALWVSKDIRLYDLSL